MEMKVDDGEVLEMESEKERNGNITGKKAAGKTKGNGRKK